MDPATSTGLVRVSIISDDGGADIALPIKLPIRQLIPQIQRTLAAGRDTPEENPDNQNGQAPAEPDAADNAPIRPFSLAPIGGVPFSRNANLGALGVIDGELLMLQMLPPGPTAPPIVEDIADAAAIYSAKMFPQFSHAVHFRAAAQAAFVAVGEFATALGFYAWHATSTWWPKALLGVIALVFIGATFLTSRRSLTAVSGRLAVASYLPLTLALYAAIPSDAAAPRVFLAAAGVLAWGLILAAATSTYRAVHTALITLSSVVLLTAALRVVLHVPYVTLGCALVSFGLWASNRSPIISAAAAKFPLPNVPAVGEPVPPPPTRAELEALPGKVAASHAYQVGINAGSVLLTVIGSVLMLWLPDRPSLVDWLLSLWVVAATSIITVLRIRIWDSAAVAMWFLSNPLLTAAALTVAFTATGHLLFAGVTAASVLAGITLMILAAATTHPQPLSILQRRALDFFENTLLFSLVPTVLWLTGLPSYIANLGSLW